MRITLRDFQEEAVAALTRRLDQARREWAADGQLQAVGLAAPTGSGKTVIATAAIEGILFGSPDSPPQPNAMFLWLTDQPELNLQTRNKMLTTSSSLTTDRLLVIENTYDAPFLSPGLVYFLNTQKLGERATLIQPTSDLHITPFWDTVNATIEDPAMTLYVVIDEAHRGMVENPREREQANSILQRFIKGSDEMRPSPIVLGVSATPQRYETVIAGTGRTSRPYTVSPEVVRESGLLKERIVVSHAGGTQTGDMTLLRKATRDWKEISDAWAAYCTAQGETPVVPALVVQVEDERGNSISASPIPAVLRAIREEVPGLPDTAFVHAFQDHGALTFGETPVRYVAPSDISDDTDARVILFKKSLNAGWDCPRAEVMFSFRRAADYTNIAQLIGRMVRAPLVRRVTEDERLNGVGLYLPYYNAANVRTVVEHLTGAGEAAAAVDVVEADKVVALTRAGGSEDIFTALEALPHYTVPRTRKSSDIRRLDALARALAIDEIDAEAVGRERGRLVEVLLAARGRLTDDAAFQEAVAEHGTIKVRKVEWIYGEATTADETAETFTLEVSEENVATLFAAAGRSLGGEVHQGYWEARAEQDSAARTTGRLELVALATRNDVRAELERSSQTRIRELFDSFGEAIDDLQATRRSVYTTIQGSSATPERIAFRPPRERAEFPVGDAAWERHVYADENGEARIELGSAWEVEALRAALDAPDAAGWLRNVPRKEWSFCVPYEVGTEWRAMYPDFLVVRQAENGLRVDILDPHNPGLQDAHYKAKGLAKFAADHGHRFGRIEIVAKIGNELVSLDLKDEPTRERVSHADSPAALRGIFAAA